MNTSEARVEAFFVFYFDRIIAKIWTAASTVGLLVASASAGTTKLLGLAAAGIRDEESAVVGEENILDLLLGGLIDVWVYRWER